MTIGAGDLKKGMAIELDGEPHVVVEFERTKMQQRAPTTRVRFRSLRTGKVAICQAAFWRPKGRGCSKSLLRHSLTWSSCPAAYSLDALGGSIRSKWFALGTAVCNRSAQAHCKSGSAGNSSSRFCSSSRRFCTCAAT